MAHEAGANLRFVLCLADHRERKRRLAERVARPSQLTGDAGTMDDGSDRWLPLLPASALKVRTVSSVRDQLQNIVEYV